MRRHLTIAALAGLGLLAALPGAASAQDPAGTGSPNLSFVKNLPFEQKYTDQPGNYGTDVEFATVRGKKHAVAGSYYNGMHIVDISKPDRAKIAGVYDCGILQGDVQVFRAADRSGRTLAAYTADSASRKVDSACFKEAAALGFEPIAANGRGKQGTFIVDISNPSRPKTVSFVELTKGSHNMTVHPGGGFLYNSNSELITSLTPSIEVVDVRNPAAPKRAGDLTISPRPGLGTESHDITFNEKGTRAYSAALSHGVVLDTTNPGQPKIVSEFDDEAINVWHQSDPVTLRGRDGVRREFLIAEDEFAGAAGGPVCPSGGVHVYDITGAKERSPEKVGYWNIQNVGPTRDPEGTCTAHVFDIHEDEQLMTIAFYDGGVRVVDLAGLTSGGALKEIASYRTKNADTWSFKAPSVTRNGAFYAYGNDIKRGLDIYRYDGRKGKSSTPGLWVPGPAVGEPGSGRSSSGAGPTTTLPKLPVGVAASSRAAGAPTVTPSLAGYRMNCLIGSTS